MFLSQCVMLPSALEPFGTNGPNCLRTTWDKSNCLRTIWDKSKNKIQHMRLHSKNKQQDERNLGPY